MAAERYTHKLTGCAPIPLAHYLKALGILRLVGEQADYRAQGWWSGDVFHLRTKLDQVELCTFFLETYSPTPIVGPWGARSGFFPGSSENSARAALQKIEKSKNARVQAFSAAIDEVRRLLGKLHLQDKAESDAEKFRLMVACRAELPDELLAWLDTTFVLLANDRRFPPLLGTGGNEGSGSYMSGFAQQVVDVLLDRRHDDALPAALFGTISRGTSTNQTPGHFSPNAAGGPNASQGFEGGLTTNAWDYVLGLEGTLLFAAAVVRQLEGRDDGSLGYPFCVRPTAAGYSSSADSDEESGRAEMWLPLWMRASSYHELRLLFSEGRATVNRRSARNGVDFARAIATLGVDRGISEFERFGFHQRNGLSNFAIPLGRFRVHAQPAAALIDEIDDWVNAFRRAATGKNAPSRARRALRRLDNAILQFCRSPGTSLVQRMLIALADAEAAVASSPHMLEESRLRPLRLSSKEWLYSADDGLTEFRLAASLAGLNDKKVGGLRQYLEAVDVSGQWPDWNKDLSASTSVVWSEGPLLENLLAVLSRRSQQVIRIGETGGHDVVVFPGHSCVNAELGDVGRFLCEDVDDQKVSNLIRGLSLLDWRQFASGTELKRGELCAIPDATFSLLKLCYTPYSIRDRHVQLDPVIGTLAAAGRLGDASRRASRRLIGSGLPAAFSSSSRSGDTRRLAAALLFPLRQDDVRSLARSVLRVERNESLV